MELACFKRFVTRIVTVSPSRHLSVGPGIEPLIVVAVRALPVKLTGVSAMVRSNSVPDSSLARAEARPRDCARPVTGNKAPSTPPLANPCTNVRRVGSLAPSIGSSPFSRAFPITSRSQILPILMASLEIAFDQPPIYWPSSNKSSGYGQRNREPEYRLQHTVCLCATNTIVNYIHH